MMIRYLKALFNRTFRKKQVDVLLKRMSYEVAENGNYKMDLLLKHPGVQTIAAELVSYFIATGAENFCELSMVDYATMTPLVVIIQRQDKLSPAVVAGIYREALEAIANDPINPDVRGIALAALLKVGYNTKEAEVEPK